MHLYRSGMPLALLSEFLGHQDPETTLIYAFTDTEMKREAIKKASENSTVISNDTERGIWEGDGDQFHKKFTFPMSDKAHSMNFI